MYSLDNCLLICFYGVTELKDMAKTAPNQCYPRAVLVLLASTVPKTKIEDTPNFLNSKVITGKKLFANYNNYWQFFLPKVFSSVVLHSQGAGGVFLFLLMKQCLQSCVFSSIFFLLLQYPAVA